jgi:hypothetical protein
MSHACSLEHLFELFQHFLILQCFLFPRSVNSIVHCGGSFFVGRCIGPWIWTMKWNAMLLMYQTTNQQILLLECDNCAGFREACYNCPLELERLFITFYAIFCHCTITRQLIVKKRPIKNARNSQKKNFRRTILASLWKTSTIVALYNI